MTPKTLPSREYLREAIDYNPSTGELRWRKRPLTHFPSAAYHKRWNSKLAGRLAGTTTSTGYRQIHIYGRIYFAHRLAWLLAHGEPMPIEIDHADGDRLNNRLANLRAASVSDNRVNRHGPGNPTGIKGVRFSKGGRFTARIMKNRREIPLGTYDTLEEAAAARREAAHRLHGAFARHD